MNLNKYEDAIKSYKQAIKFNANNADYFNNLANTYNLAK